jgi:hypothetical protein
MTAILIGSPSAFSDSAKATAPTGFRNQCSLILSSAIGYGRQLRAETAQILSDAHTTIKDTHRIVSQAPGQIKGYFATAPERARDYLRSAPSRLKALGGEVCRTRGGCLVPNPVKRFSSELCRTRGGCLLLSDPVDYSQVSAIRRLNPFHYIFKYGVNKPVEMVTEQLLYTRKSPSVAVVMLLSFFTYKTFFLNPVHDHEVQTIEYYANQYAEPLRELLNNNRLYFGIRDALKSGIETDLEAREDAYSLSRIFTAYYQSLGDVDLYKFDPVTHFENTPLFVDPTIKSDQYKLNDVDKRELFRLSHIEYIQFFKFEEAFKTNDLVAYLEPWVIEASPFRKNLLNAYSEGRMTKEALRYLMQQDFDFEEKYNSAALIDRAAGTHLSPSTSLEEVRAAILNDLGLSNPANPP